VKHYQITKGTPCSIRAVGSSNWKSYATTKRLFFTECREEEGYLVFTHEGYELRVEPSLIGGAKKSEQQAPPALAPVTAPAGMVTLTREMVHAGKSNRGGWTKAQVSLLGVEWPPQPGWIERLDGTRIREETYNAFLAARKDPPVKGQASAALTAPTEVPAGMVVLTRELIHAGKYGSGSWTREQRRLLGVTENPPQKGWLNALIGTPITEEAYRAFLAAKPSK
jgi:hypothetical protein